jgi:hypothetical protein
MLRVCSQALRGFIGFVTEAQIVESLGAAVGKFVQ